MIPRLIPLYFPTRDADFDTQVQTLSQLLAGEAELLPPLPLGAPLPEAEAVVFPQMLGDAFRQLADFKRLQLPILVITSEFGTLSMWDWEICSYLRSEGVETIAPYNLEQTRQICKALGVRRELQGAKFLVYQDNPGAGFQANIFKRFYWWEDECIQRMQARFGLTVVKKSFRQLGADAQAISDTDAEAAWQDWSDRLPLGNISHHALLSAVKIYLALKRDVVQDGAIQAMGINCLNESHFSDTTPCLAWNMLHEEMGLIWGCEADLVSMLTMYILRKSLSAPLMMTNLYPFLMGQAALHHERIPDFPHISEPENHLLLAHCGFLGVLPRPYATEWALRRKVLAIVNDNATAIDARLPEGDITLAKLHPDFDQLDAVEGSLVDYAQYPSSDCLNGAVIRVPDGRKLMDSLVSHHYVLLTGHYGQNLALVAKVFGLKVNQ